MSLFCVIGLGVTDEIMLGKADWYKLFEPTNFFSKYRFEIILGVAVNYFLMNLFG